MSKYYYLVAGLPELTLEDSKLSYTVADFRTELYPALSEDDKRLIDCALERMPRSVSLSTYRGTGGNGEEENPLG